jgi:hypothetical protein
MNPIFYSKKFIVTFIILIIIIFGIIEINRPSEFLNNSYPGGYAIVFQISKETSKANEVNVRLRDLGGTSMTSSKRYYIFCQDSKYIYSRIDRYSDSKIDSAEMLVLIDNILIDLKINNYVEYAVIYENGLAQSSSGFNVHLFP